MERNQVISLIIVIYLFYLSQQQYMLKREIEDIKKIFDIEKKSQGN